MPDGPGPVTGAPGSSLIEPARLTEARERLRGAIAGPEVSLPAGTEAARDQRRSLERAFRRLASRDAAAAGRLLLALLPLQASVWPGPIAYDLVLAGDRCLEVTSRDGRTAVRVRRQPRPPAAAELSLTGDPGRVARLVVAGRLRRLVGWGVARIRGRRDAIGALEALLRAPLDPVALHRAGVRLDAATALALVSAAVEPSWTRGERFVLACGEPVGPLAALEVRSGRAAIAPRAKPGARVTTTIRCRAAELLPALGGEHVSSLTVDGDERPLALVREWIERASSG